MPSRSSVEFMERQKLKLRPQRGILHTVGTNHCHFRDIKFPAEILPEDTPSRRVLTQKQEDRVAYQPPSKENCCT